jgi:hypothetical protein
VFQVATILEDSKKIFGTCNEARLFVLIADALQLVANKGDFDPYTGFIDLCVDDQHVTLPREVDAVLGVNIGGKPTLGRDQLFAFHANGPGDCTTGCSYTWDDKGYYPVYRDIDVPAKLIADVQIESDEGKSIIVYGYDDSQRVVRQHRNGLWQDGWAIPTLLGYNVPDSGMPLFSRITRISKEAMNGTTRLSTYDVSGSTGVLLGVYEPDELEPSYRRIKLNRACDWVRLAYRKTSPTITSLYDRVPLRSRLGFTLAMRAVKAYSEPDLASAAAFEAHATRLEIEAQQVAESATMMPVIQVDMGNNLNDKSDYVD